MLSLQHNLKVKNPLYGQLVIGPPGSGKTTFCHKINEFYKELDRKVTVINLDPANEQMSYNASIDIVSIFEMLELDSNQIYFQIMENVIHFADEINNRC